MSDLPSVRHTGSRGNGRMPRTTAPGAMYTVNDEPTWLSEATPTERMRLKYEVRPSIDPCCCLV